MGQGWNESDLPQTCPIPSVSLSYAYCFEISLKLLENFTIEWGIYTLSNLDLLNTWFFYVISFIQSLRVQ